VEMVTLGNRFMHPRLSGEVVAFEDRDRVKVIGENPRRHQACQAPTDDDRVLTKVMCHMNFLPSFCRCGSAPVLHEVAYAFVPLNRAKPHAVCLDQTKAALLHPEASSHSTIVACHAPPASTLERYVRRRDAVWHDFFTHKTWRRATSELPY